MTKQGAVKLSVHGAVLARLSPLGAAAHLGRGLRSFLKNHGQTAAARLHLGASPGTENRALALRYEGGAYEGPLLLVRVPARRPDAPLLGWGAVARGPVEVVDLPRPLEGSMSDGNRRELARLLRVRLDRASEPDQSATTTPSRAAR
jgi:hypothetical protein